MIFDNVISNFGSAFEPQSSVFMCPVSGVYMFGLSLMNRASAHTEVALYVDEGLIFRVIADDVGGVFASASNFAFASCNQGQRVWIKTIKRVNQLSIFIMTGTPLSRLCW